MIGSSYYLEPNSPIGEFSRAFFIPLMQRVVERMAQIEKVPRR